MDFVFICEIYRARERVLRCSLKVHVFSGIVALSLRAVDKVNTALDVVLNPFGYKSHEPAFYSTCPGFFLPVQVTAVDLVHILETKFD